MTFLSLLQLIISVGLIVLILLQERSSGASGIFGGGEGGFYQTRRGLEKTIFIATIIHLAVFVALSLLNLLH